MRADHLFHAVLLAQKINPRSLLRKLGRALMGYLQVVDQIRGLRVLMRPLSLKRPMSPERPGCFAMPKESWSSLVTVLHSPSSRASDNLSFPPWTMKH